jgi:type I restriction enzyme, R subunit
MKWGPRIMMHPAFTDTAHREKYFEEYIVKQLSARGWLIGETSGYDQNHAIYPEDPLNIV